MVAVQGCQSKRVLEKRRRWRGCRCRGAGVRLGTILRWRGHQLGSFGEGAGHGDGPDLVSEVAEQLPERDNRRRGEARGVQRGNILWPGRTWPQRDEIRVAHQCGQPRFQLDVWIALDVGGEVGATEIEQATTMPLFHRREASQQADAVRHRVPLQQREIAGVGGFQQ